MIDCGKVTTTHRTVTLTVNYPDALSGDENVSPPGSGRVACPEFHLRSGRNGVRGGQAPLAQNTPSAKAAWSGAHALPPSRARNQTPGRASELPAPGPPRPPHVICSPAHCVGPGAQPREACSWRAPSSLPWTVGKPRPRSSVTIKEGGCQAVCGRLMGPLFSFS